MKVITNILISVLSFAISYGIAHLTGSVIVKNAVLLAYVIPVSYTHLTLPTKA